MDLFQLVAKLGLDSSEYEKEIGKSKGLISSLGSSISAKAVAIGNLTADLVKKAAGSLVELGKTGLDYNRQMEDYTANFKVMLGSTEAAANKVEELKEMAAHTPFEMSDLADATQTLLAFGIESDKTNDIMQMLGDVSLGNSQKFSSLATVFGQVSSTGKLMGQDLLQFINQGFNPLQVIADKTGASMADLKNVMSGGKTSKEFQKMVKAAQAEVKKLGANASQSAILLSQIGEDGAISAKVVEEAFVLATTEGGQFYKGMEEASKTQSGLISTLKDNWNALIGKAMKPASDFLTSTLLPKSIEAVDRLSAAYDQGGFAALLDEAGKLVKETASALFENITFPTWEDVKSGFTAAWKKIKAGATSVAKLAFGETEGGGIDWPTWEDVQTGFTTAWGAIKSGALSVARLVFGETQGGGIRWPTWEDVQAGFTAAWGKIKAGAFSVARLVFGETENGGIDWPTWEDVKSGFSAAWDKIKSGASTVAKLVFGETEGGGIDWPTWEEVKTGFKTAWGNIKSGIESVANWTLGQFGYPDVNTVIDTVSTWWGGQGNNTYERVKSVLTWTFGKLDPPKFPEFEDQLKTWWGDNKTGFKGALTGIVQWTFGDLIVPAWADLMFTVSNWWEYTMKPALSKILPWNWGKWEHPSLEELIADAKAWWASVKDTVSSIFHVVISPEYKKTYTQEELQSAVTPDVVDTVSSASYVQNTPTKASNADGLSYVPYNDYLSYLHKGEAVLTAAQAEDWRASRSASAPAAIDYAALGRAVAQAIAGLSVQMDGQTVGHIVAPTVSADIAEGSRSTRRYAVV